MLAQSQIFPENPEESVHTTHEKFPDTDVGMFKLCFLDNNTSLINPAYDTIISDTDLT